MAQAQIAIIGLGVMGGNLARNFAGRGVMTAVYNRTWQRTEDYLKQYGGAPLSGYENLSDLVAALQTPRKIILMVQAGAPVDEMLEQLLPLLEKGDYVIDGGNSFFTDTERRQARAAESGVNFVGMGISGGEEGALYGPSLMPGLTKEQWPEFEPLLTAVAAKDFAGQACCAPLDGGGAGHYVKMVHNGIEYAMMQLIAEIYDFNRKALGLSAAEISQIFAKANMGKSASFLVEITSKVLAHNDAITGQSVVDIILDKAAQKGTGGWTSIESLRLGAGAEMIGEAVAARSLSSLKSLREILSATRSVNQSDQVLTDINWDNVLYTGMLIAYVQGFFLINLAARQYNWQIDLAEVCRIWQGGCIIRSKLLIDLREAYLKNREIEHPLESTNLTKLIQDNWPDWREFILAATESNIAIPASASAYNYFLTITDNKTPANLIQGLRDFFGAHTFERVDRPGIFHENWTN